MDGVILGFAIVNTSILVWVAFKVGVHSKMLNQIEKNCPIFRKGEK